MSFVIKTAADIAAARAAARAQSLKADCRARILSVASANAQANITQAGARYAAMRADNADQPRSMAAAGFIEGDMARVAELTAWIRSMQVACRTAIETGADPDWPEPSQDVRDLVARF